MYFIMKSVCIHKHVLLQQVMRFYGVAIATFGGEPFMKRRGPNTEKSLVTILLNGDQMDMEWKRSFWKASQSLKS